MATLFEVVKLETAAFLADVRAKIKDGVSFTDAKTLFSDLMVRAMTAAQSINDAPGGDKKEVVLAALEEAFDKLVVPYDMPKIPAWLESILETQFRAQIRPLFGPIIDGVVVAFWVKRIFQ